MLILLATTNPGKLREIAAVMADPGITLVDLGSLQREIAEPVEDGDTFEANAILKARHYAAASGMWCLADDSGLEVDALGGAPGVRSARFADIEGPRDVVDPANNALLLDKLGRTPASQRTARFVCAMALLPPLPLPGAGEGRGEGSSDSMPDTRHPIPAALVRGTFEGRIILPTDASDPDQPHLGRGTYGFGYDPLFLPDATPGRTSAELTPAEKNAISHRGDAARQMLAALRRLLASTPAR